MALHGARISTPTYIPNMIYTIVSFVPRWQVHHNTCRETPNVWSAIITSTIESGLAQTEKGAVCNHDNNHFHEDNKIKSLEEKSHWQAKALHA